MLAAGSDHTCALTTAGEIWCWGSNATGQLARDPETTPASPRPLRIEEIGTEGAFVAAGDTLTCAARRDGSAWCWGGRPVPVDPKVRVAQVLTTGSSKLTDVVEIAIGRTAMARRKDGSAVVWGLACEIKFGCGLQAQPLMGSAMSQISINGATKEETAFCGVGGDGSAYCAGWNTYGQLGLPMDKSLVLWKDFRRLDALGGDVAELRVGWRFGCARKQDGSLWCWGANDIGQLGSGTQDRGTAMPTRAAGVGGAVRKLRFGAQNQVYAEVADGNAWVWGANQYGQLGVPDQAALRAPAKTALFAGNQTIALGANHTCILRAGDVWCVGLGEDGQLGNGLSKDSANLVRVRMCR